MQPCYLTIITTADGKKTQLSGEGQLSVSLNYANISYQQDGSLVDVSFSAECVQIKRVGDYTLRLSLIPNQRTQGALGIGGREGEVQTQTYRAEYSIGKDSLLASLHYDLIIGEERQEMKLRIIARYKGKNNED